MKTIYNSDEGKQKILALYDAQMKRLPIPYHDICLETTYGKTHLIETGNLEGIPLLLFHGGNATTAYNLLACDFLFADFHIYAVDTIGHPGKSAENSLSPNTYDYGNWAGQVIEKLGYKTIRCFGGSFGAGVIAKTMCVAPQMMEKVVLYVPAAIKNAPAYKSMSMMCPMIAYWITHKDKWLKKAILPMAVQEENINDDIYETAKASINYAKIKTGMPSDVEPEKMRKCTAPVLVMAAEQDCLFPAEQVIPQAKKMLANCQTYLLRGRGHMHYLTEEEKRMIVEFLI